MLLAIDVGNTNTVFALCEGNAVKHSWRCQTNAMRTGDEYASWLSILFQIEDYKFSDVKDIVMSSVVPDANFNLKRLAKKYLHCDPIMVTIETVLPHIKVNIDNPQTAGADLLVNAVACDQHYNSEAILVDFGTATTLSVLTKSEGYSGGIIAPGVNLSLEALVSAAAKLPKVSIQKPPFVRGANTIHAMQSGIFWGYISMVEGLIQRLSEEIGHKPFVIATGGLASVFAPHIEAIKIVDVDLTLKGLIKIYTSEKEKL